MGRYARTVCTLVFVALLGACQGDAAVNDAPARQAAEPDAPQGVGIRQVVVRAKVQEGGGNDLAHIPLRASDSVVVAVQTLGPRGPAQLEAKVFNLSDGSLSANLEKQLDQSDGASESELVFDLGQLAAGRHMLELYLDGKLVEQRDFEVMGDAAPATAD